MRIGFAAEQSLIALATSCVQAKQLSLPRGRRLTLGDLYMRWHVLVLLGYAVAGKGFAYLGVGSLYVGEITLAAGLVIAATTKAMLRMPRSATVLLLLMFLVWNGVRALPGLSVYGVDTLRDSVVWAYGLFALLVAGIVSSRPDRLAWVIRQYRRFGRAFIVIIPGVWLLYALYGDGLPRFPGTDFPVLHPKPNDILVHLAGIGSFQLLGLAPTSAKSLLLLSLGFALAAVRTRGGLLAFGLSIALTALARPRSRRLWMAVAGAAIAIPLLLYVETGVSVSGRELSARQLLANVSSIIGGGHRSDLDGPKRWRLAWWSQIIDYTIFGPHFWLGKGFGVNLATDDGFTLDARRSLRSPHNSHLTILARAGVPGLLLWILVQLSWLREMYRSYRRSCRTGQRHWCQLFLFLIAYWLAFLANAAFDVSLEGPMAGVWFWTVFGVGLAAARIYKPATAVPHARPPFPLSQHRG